MATTIEELTALTSPAAADILAIVDDPGAVGEETKKITAQDLMKVVNVLSSLSTADDTADRLLIYDSTASDVKKIAPSALLEIVSQLTELASGLADSDEVLVIDGGEAKRMTATNFYSDYVEKQPIRTAEVECFSFKDETNVETGDGEGWLRIPSDLDGYNLVEVHAEVRTAGTTGTTDIQIHNVDNAVDMLSTKLTIDSGETGSDTAATAAVINTSNDHVNENDVLRIDVDAVSSTAPKGLIVTLGFQKP